MPGYPASCSELNHFDLLYVLSYMYVRVPDSGTVFNSRSHKGFVCSFYPGNMPLMLNKDLTRFIQILPRVRQNGARV